MSAHCEPKGQLSERQRHEMTQAVIALTRLESTVKAIRVWARRLADTDMSKPDEADDFEVSCHDIAILADVARDLQIDVAEALSLAFDGLSWNYDHPGFPKAADA